MLSGEKQLHCQVKISCPSGEMRKQLKWQVENSYDAVQSGEESLVQSGEKSVAQSGEESLAQSGEKKSAIRWNYRESDQPNLVSCD